MAYVPIPRDLTKIKSKVAFNLTKRQLVCFSCGALVGVPLYFALKNPLGNSTASMCMILVMLPFFIFAMYEKNGQPMEKVLKSMLNVILLRPKQRAYKTNNYYAVLMRQYALDREVRNIVRGTESPTVWLEECSQTPGKKRKKTHTRRESANRSSHCTGESNR